MSSIWLAEELSIESSFPTLLLTSSFELDNKGYFNKPLSEILLTLKVYLCH